MTRSAAVTAAKPRQRLLAWLFVFLAPPLAMALLVRLATALGWNTMYPLLLASLGTGAVALNALLGARSAGVRIASIAAYGAAMWFPTMLLGVFGLCVFSRCA